MNKKTLALGLALALALLLAACGGKATPAPTDTPVPTATPTPEPIPSVGGVDVAMQLVNTPTGPNVAVVNGVAIASELYMGELERQLIYITEQYALDWSDPQIQTYLPQIEQQTYWQLINLELARQLATTEGIVISDDALAQEIESTRQSILSSGIYTDWDNFLAVNKITDAYFRDRIRDSMVVDELVKRHGGPTEAEQVHAQHILVADAETAQKVLDELKAGKTFEELAVQYSQDTGSKDSGGDLGWFPRGVMVTAFEEAAFSLAVGEISQPVQTDFGYHIIKVLGKEVRPLDAEMLEQMQEQAFSEWFSAQRDQAKIEELLTWQ
ncbi:MAG: peptidylprolyl isomerase [Chloroflexi bacterium]|nr:peptidylprolyl isomerase [Chloroflexota bacterium]